jgi:hypothetical protein
MTKLSSRPIKSVKGEVIDPACVTWKIQAAGKGRTPQKCAVSAPAADGIHGFVHHQYGMNRQSGAVEP